LNDPDPSAIFARVKAEARAEGLREAAKKFRCNHIYPFVCALSR
jgi:hypothetical protein